VIHVVLYRPLDKVSLQPLPVGAEYQLRFRMTPAFCVSRWASYEVDCEQATSNASGFGLTSCV
jgi:hypothetical protein